MEATSTKKQAARQFEVDGFVGPIRVLDSQECRDLANALRDPGRSIAWPKGRAPESRLLFELASNRILLDTVELLLGPDVALFAASLVSRLPGQIHPWHTDMETAHAKGNAVSVWIGLEHTNANSSLQVVSRSHKLGETIQQAASARNVARSGVSADDVLGWATERDPQCEFVNVAMTNGMAVVFDGRLWHGSDNTNPRKTRLAVLLQYAAPDFPARIPNPATTEWPFSYYQIPKPPCIMVRGSADNAVNEYVPPPDRDGSRGSLITKWVRQFDLPLARNQDKVSKYHPVFSGRTRVLDDMACHVSVLEPGQTPHPPHHHREEEILIMLDGEAELVSVVDGSEVRRRVSRGDFAYYPGGFLHTITNPSSSEPATYLMFKWFGREATPTQPTPASFVRHVDVVGASDRGHTIKKVLEGPTQYLRRLHSHTSALAPRGGYGVHVDAHDVAIIILDGAVETMGQEVRANGVIYFSAGEPHDLHNVGDEPAQYIVFEFHPEGRLTDMGLRYNVRQAFRTAKKVAKRLGGKKVIAALRSLRG